MKNTKAASLVALLLLSLAAPRLTAAQAAANGNYRIVFRDELMKSVEFQVTAGARGAASGWMVLIDQARIPDTDDVEAPPAGDPPAEFFIEASLNSLKVTKNRAVMNGTVRDSSHKNYLGRWVQLVVEDNGKDLKKPDRLTWSFCQPAVTGWIPADKELEEDEGTFQHWWATDAEREDDQGIPSRNLLGDREDGCPVHPLSSYTFVRPAKWEGDLVVQP